MKLSTRSTYGMRALVELALALGHGPISATLIAKRQELPVAYLEQLLHRLKIRGLVNSVRGPRGGYELAKGPDRITMADVVRVLDGANDNGIWSEAPSKMPKRRHGEGAGALPRSSRDLHRYAQRIAETVYRCVYDRLEQSLDAVTLQDLCDEVRSQTGEPLDHRYVFHI